MKKTILGLALALPASFALGQANHQHYEKPDAAASQPGPAGELAPRLQNLGSYAFTVTTKSPQAQRFFNQGIDLTYGFNHAEAGRAYKEAARLDPNLAMAYWGQALVLGPNINMPMDKAEEPKALELIKKAQALKAKASLREQAYIDALAQRYSGKPEERSARDHAYADAMGALSKRYPDDLDAATMYAESLMDLRPWGYWAPDGSANPGTANAIAVLERVLSKKPDHPGATHYYIHVMEATASPEKAEQAADTLLKLMPGAGHMVHMPSHIYQRVGRYADAASANEQAILADEDYITQCRAQGLYPIGYYPHNIHFLWFASSAEGRSQVAIEAARKAATKVDDAMLDQIPLLVGFKIPYYYALTRFGKWNEMLAEPAPPEKRLYLSGMWHYNRGLAFVGKGQLDEAEKELRAVRGIAADKGLDFNLFSPNKANQVFAIAPETLAGEIAAQRRKYDEAIDHLDRAVRLEDALVYTEPAEWHYPSRLRLGAVLLDAGRARESEVVYWEDLRRNRDNGWSLFGLAQALRAQGRDEEAAAIDARFKKAWARADVTLRASRF